MRLHSQYPEVYIYSQLDSRLEKLGDLDNLFLYINL